MLHSGHACDSIDVVFDVYHCESVTSTERIQRGSTEGIGFSYIKPGHKIKKSKRLICITILH